ncbi:MAG: DUF4115 domain-containing protein [Thiothrix sp.]|uniref:helix-turn-helix domain-containing protein n=1 Tax=Thiothrix sp. TaxID=1032 RepID=UPI0026110851|nr:RodZ domain-containing protein [Thiothrix sp.]MDD5392453.1 DUF4115 domain-containing protein [Thiothrix sp.]
MTETTTPVEEQSSAVQPGDLTAKLAECREKAGLDLEQAADEMHLSANLLRSLEKEDFARLPEPPYVRGYLRGYAKLASVDAKDLIRIYEALRGADPDEIAHHFAPARSLSRVAQPSVSPVVIKLVLLAAVIIGLGAVVMSSGVQEWASNTWTSFSAQTAPPQVVRPAPALETFAAQKDAEEKVAAEQQTAASNAAATTPATPAAASTTDSAATSTAPATPTASATADTTAPTASPAAPATDTATATATTTAVPDSKEAKGTETASSTTPATPAAATTTTASSTADKATATDTTTVTPAATPATATTPPATATAPTTAPAAATTTDSTAATTATPPATAADGTTPATPTDAAAAPTIPPIAGEVNVKLEFADDVWMQVKDDGKKTVFESLNSKGTTKEFKATTPLNFKIGNAPGVKVYLNGQLYDQAPHIKGSVARFKVE